MRLKIKTSLQILSLFFAVVSAHASESSSGSLDTGLYESFYSAIEMDRANEVKKFIEFGADINHRFKGKKTPLMIASSMGSISAVRALLEMGADTNLVSDEDMTAMDYAKDKNDTFIVAVLKTNHEVELAEVSEIELPEANVVEIEASHTPEITKKPAQPKVTKNISAPKVSKISKPKVVALLSEDKKEPLAKKELKKIGNIRDITGSYKTNTKAKFYKCGAHNKTIEYLAEENIHNQNNNGKFSISYTSPLLECKGNGKLLPSSNILDGKYNCSYTTERGYRGTLKMKIAGTIENDKLIMKYVGQDTSPGITCHYEWQRVNTLN